MSLCMTILIAVSLSMDAFSLALSIGTMSLTKKMNLLLSLVVGAFHFFMPLLGSCFGNIFVEMLHVEAHFLSSIIFFYIAIIMFKDFKEEKKENFKMTAIGIIIFALGVSLDSFGVGFVLNLTGFNIVLTPLIFTIFSFSFTFVGLLLGKKLSNLVGIYSELAGAIIMFLLAMVNFCKFLFLS